MAGNATVTLYDGSSATGTTVYELWLQSIDTSTENQFISQQTRDYVAWTPIRRSEMFVDFSALWPYASSKNSINTLSIGYEDIDPTDGFAKMNKFQDAVRAHQVAIINGSTSLPMVLDYINNSDPSSSIYNSIISATPLSPLQFNGWIQNAEKQYVRFQNVFVTSYTMNILTKNTSGAAGSTMATGGSISYAPTAADQNAYGSTWVNLSSTGILADAKSIGATIQSNYQSTTGGVPNG